MRAWVVLANMDGPSFLGAGDIIFRKSMLLEGRRNFRALLDTALLLEFSVAAFRKNSFPKVGPPNSPNLKNFIEQAQMRDRLFSTESSTVLRSRLPIRYLASLTPELTLFLPWWFLAIFSAPISRPAD